MTNGELILVASLAGFAVLLALVWYLDSRRRKRGDKTLGGVFGAFDEVFHPEAANAAEIREIQEELPAPSPLAGDPIRPDGTIRIELKSKEN